VIENLPIFIEDVYNRIRVHSGIGYLTPKELEKAVQQQPEMASRFELTLLALRLQFCARTPHLRRSISFDFADCYTGSNKNYK
jgi:hypothetical protein